MDFRLASYWGTVPAKNLGRNSCDRQFVNIELRCGGVFAGERHIASRLNRTLICNGLKLHMSALVGDVQSRTYVRDFLVSYLQFGNRECRFDLTVANRSVAGCGNIKRSLCRVSVFQCGNLL